MATTTPPKETNNPGQKDYEDLVQREAHASNYHQRQQSLGRDLYDSNEEPDRDKLKEKEESPDEPQHENVVGAGYKQTTNTRKNITWLVRHRKAVFGGGALSAAIALIVFFISSGPLQFIHLAHLLEQWHFSSQQDQQDNRFMKEARFIRYASSGEVQKTRMGYLGNKLTDTFETNLNKSGFKSAYSPKFGLFDGYTIDRSNEKYKGKSDEEIKKLVKAETGLDVVDGGSVRSNLRGELVINAKGLGYFKTKSLNTTVLTQAKYSKISAAVGARLMCRRAGCTLHPLKLLSNKTKSAVEDWWKNRKIADEKGQEALKTAQNEEQDKNATDAEKNATTEGNNAINDTESEAAAAKDDPGKFDQFKTSLGGRIAGGGAAAIGIFCTVKGINQNAGEIKQTQVVMPLIRMGTEMIGVGNQLESGQDISAEELGKYSALLHGKDSSGQQTGWEEAQSILAEEGHSYKKDVGKPSNTLTSIGQGVPFDFVNHGVFAAVLGPACSVGGQILTGGFSLALTFTGIGGLIGQISGAIVQNIAAGPILDQIAHWLAGSAVDVNAVGADFGNSINFGTKLAANDQAVAAGGKALSKDEDAQLTAFENSQAEKKFQSHSLAYRLFNTHDERSAISKVIDNANPDPAQNIAKIGSLFSNFGRTFSTVSSLLFSGSRAAAAAGSYNYGFPTYGFSQAEMDNANVENPFENACYVVGCHDSTHNITGIFEGSSRKDLISKAKKCFGVTISQDAGRWNVTGADNKPPSPYDSKYADSSCNDSSLSWLRIRFFIYDTETMNSMACFAGNNDDADIKQSCEDIGFDETQVADTTSDSTNSSGTLPTGSAKDLATQLKKYVDNGKIKCLSSGCPDIVRTANGQSTRTGSCYVNSLDPKLLGMLLELAQMGHTFILSAVCSDHPSNPSSLHHQGKAADFNTIDGTFMGPSDVPWSGVKIAAAKKLDQDIASFMPKSTGFGQEGGRCHPHFDFLNGFNLFDDACHHQHVQVG